MKVLEQTIRIKEGEEDESKTNTGLLDRDYSEIDKDLIGHSDIKESDVKN